MKQLEINEIVKRLPHRYPFLLIDRVLDYTKEESLRAIKNVTINEPFFAGHFPRYPVMPGVLVIEAMAQACGVLTSLTLDQYPGDHAVYLFVGIDSARFKHPVQPGDQLRIDVNVIRRMRGIWKFQGTAHVDDKLCCEAELMCTYKELE